jgi:thiosulfate/3-mercaptopyruvate sulfurtransferase
MSLVDTDWLEKNFDQVKIIDCSWHMPSENRNPEEEFKNEHISNAIFFDLDEHSKNNTDLPHMLPTLEEWNEIVSNLGISNDDQIIIYDNSDVISSCRCWYNFIYFGHDPKLVSVLNGGFRKWKQENKKISNQIVKFSRTNYVGKELTSLVKDKYKIDLNISEKEFVVIDARSKERFEGNVPDPRKNVRSGSIPNSICLPYVQVINKDFSFKNLEELKNLFKNTLTNPMDKPVFSCGSGVTACVLALAYSLVNANYLPVIYDGSWAEYGKI